MKPWKMMVVNNGSHNPTTLWLKGLGGWEYKRLHHLVTLKQPYPLIDMATPPIRFQILPPCIF
jgi:hypothetical protein